MQTANADRIQVLPTQLANQIAAGEVVERPASVVKELVENSLDAGATRIDIELREGGKGLIRIQDNGSGIHADDFALALTRHATSKLRSLDDLQAIHSLGFRGEALPSIASVSRFALCSRYHDSEHAWRVSVDDSGKLSDVTPDAQPEGTRIEVEALFCNTPARRRFLRSARTEFLHVQDVVIRAALSRFDVAFTLKHNDKDILQLPAIVNNALQHRRLTKVGGKSFSRALHAIDEQRDGIRVHGWVAPASEHRAQADRQFVFINGRMVRDKVLMHAIRQAYAEQLPAGRYAMYALYLEMDPASVDVNVHPTKHEVRFREVRPVHDVLFTAVQHALHGQHEVIDYDVLKQHQQHRDHVSLHETSNVYSLQGKGHKTELAQQRVISVLPGGYALVEADSVYWLYHLEQAAMNVFAAHIHRQQDDEGIVRRPLLVPLRIQLPVESVEWLDSVHEELLGSGIDITRTGETTVLLRFIPQAFEMIDARLFIECLAGQRQLELNAIVACAAGNISSQARIDDIQYLLSEIGEGQLAQCRRQVSASALHTWYKDSE